MYIPKIFRNENIDDVKQFIRGNSFGILVGKADNKLHATHIPLILAKNDLGEDVLTGHVSGGNPQLKGITSNEEVMVIFQGPHAYISSSWYDHENVPTWNYIAVHVYGRIRILEGEELLVSLKNLVDNYEKNSENPVTVEGMSERFLSAEIKGITGFEITITEFDAAYKLSQNRDDKNYKNVINELDGQKNSNAHQIAEYMRNNRKENN